MAAEVIGGALLTVLFDRLSSQEFMDFFKGKTPTAKLNEMNERLASAVLLLNDAEEKLIKDRRVKMWLDDLKQTVYDADDLVYKVHTEAQQRKLLEGESQSRLKITTKVKNFFQTSFEKSIEPEIDEIVEKLKRLQKNNPGLRRVEKQQLPERSNAPLLTESDVYGRDADKEAIVKLLLSDDANASENNLTVIPIVGMGGIGKTTLADLVYKDERVKSNFNCKAWFTVGHGEVDCLEVMRRIIKKVTSEECKIEEPHDLQEKLREALMGRKFFFILDDFWDENRDKWDFLNNSLESGLQGSKIIVTTRSAIVASNMKTRRSPYNLGVLSYEDGWLLFAKHALIDANSKENSDLEVIGKEIVVKCQGLPLAIKSLGGLLRVKRNKEWALKILNSGISELYGSSRSNDILPALWFSYYYLPSYLKQCFAYFALFPKDYAFRKEEIILLWMAEGLIYSKNGKRIEEVGEEYFQDLISRSFFQPFGENKSVFVMHDLMHDLAIFVSSGICFEMNSTYFSDCPHNIRHFSYQEEPDDPKKFEALSKAKGLRTFLTFPNFDSDNPWSLQIEYLLESLLRTRSCLRVLFIYRLGKTKLPDSIGDLKYLRYLSLSGPGFEEIPETICNLHNLQILVLETSSVTQLPSNIGNLINLRYIRFPLYIEKMPSQIGKLKNLQKLNKFVLGKSGGSSIRQLKELKELHGTLKILGIENVVDVQDALEVELKNKKFLSSLKLYWHWSDNHVPDDSEKEKEVLGALEPHANLKELEIYKYQGTSFPNWVGDHFYSNLVKVMLSGCNNCWLLPPLGQLPSLKHLRISNFHSIVRISSEFYYSITSASSAVGTKPFRSLESLCFEYMSNLQEWSFIEGEVEGGVFPCLKELVIANCSRFKVSLPNHLPALTKLHIYSCDRLEPLLPRAQQMDAAFPIFEILKIQNCHGQELLLKGGLPSCLKEIRIWKCINLRALDEDAFQDLTSLEKLEISCCDNLRCLPRGLPNSLSYLSIDDCGLLIPRLKRETGEDWPIIAHIPTVEIISRSR